MSKVHIKVWNRNKIRIHNDDGNKEVPEELMASYISQSKLVDENSNRDLFWAAKSGDVEALERYFSNAVLGNGFECNRLDRHEMSPLHYAAKYNRVEIIKSLLQYGADIDCIGHNSETPIFIAAKHNSVAALGALIDRCGSTSLLNADGESSLHIACRHGNIQACQILLDVSPLLINEVDNDKMSSLHLACMKGKTKICTLLIEKGARVDARAVDGSMPIHYAAARGSVDLIHLLLTNSNSYVSATDQINSRDHDQQTPLHRAAQKGRTEAIKLCLEVGGDICATQKDGHTALHTACLAGQIEAAGVLIENGAQVEARDKFYKTAFHIAASSGHTRLLQLLLDNGASISNMDGKRKSALLHAIEQGKVETVNFLLDRNANYMMQDDRNQSCLHVAATYNRVTIIETLLKRGANLLINEVDSIGRTAIHYAAELGFYEVIKLLIFEGGVLDISDDDDNTPLHLACRSKSLESVQLICHHAPSLINSLGDRSRTPLHVAVACGYHEAAQFCLNFGADAEKRDGSYITPIEIAVSNGYPDIVESLLNHGISANIANANGESLLHTASGRGYYSIAKLLVDHGADVLAVDENNETCLDYAIKHKQAPIAILLFKHKYGRQLLLSVNKEGMTTMQYMIKHLPEVAKMVMDSCIMNHEIDIVRREHKHHRQMETYYDFSLIDPGPEFELQGQKSKKRNNNSALASMVEYKQHDLLMHPLAAKLRELKWQKFGQYFYYMNLCIYLVFLICLSCYGIIAEDSRVHFIPRDSILGLGLVPGTTLAPVNTGNQATGTPHSPTHNPQNQSWAHTPSNLLGSTTVSPSNTSFSTPASPVGLPPEVPPSRKKRDGPSSNGAAVTPNTNQPTTTSNTNSTFSSRQTSTATASTPLHTIHPLSDQNLYAIFDTSGYVFMATCLMVFAFINVVLEIYQLIHQRLAYFKSFSNYLDMALYSMLLATYFLPSGADVLNLFTILIFLAYVNLLFHMERLDFIGVYVLMLQSVIATALKISGIVAILTFAFGISFYTLNPKEPSFYNIPLSTIKVLDMMIGEIEFSQVWMEQIKKDNIKLPKSITALIMIVVFIFLMPIVLMNLMVGLAVGDIDKVRREAGFRSLSSRVEYLDDLERTIPVKFRQHFYMTSHKVRYIKNLNQIDDGQLDNKRTDERKSDSSIDPADVKKLVLACDRIDRQDKRIEILTEQFMSFKEEVLNALKSIDNTLKVECPQHS